MLLFWSGGVVEILLPDLVLIFLVTFSQEKLDWENGRPKESIQVSQIGMTPD
jgi:hypothetical protein